MNQFKLLKSLRFAPLFFTQFLNAFNNNLFKNALIVMLTFGAIELPKGISNSLLINLAAGLFILPFLLISGFAGVLADQREKSSMIQKLKKLELGLVIFSSIGLIFQNIYILLFCLFLLGAQAAFFGPLKYSILPQHLKQTELIGGNGLIESATFIAILTGTILGGILINLNNGAYIVSIILIIFAFLGLYSSHKIPKAPPLQNKVSEINFFGSFFKTIKTSREVKSVFLSILAISWFWFLGATLLTQFPLIVKNILHSNSLLITTLLAIFSIGIAIGSILCEKLSGHKVEIGLVPFGSFGIVISLTGFIYFLSSINNDIINQTLIVPTEHGLGFWFTQNNFIFMLISLVFVSIFSGFFTVPLYAFLQQRTSPNKRSTIIGANNIINSLFMVSSAILGIVFSQVGLTLIDLLYFLLIAHLIVSIYVFTVVPEFLLRFITWLLISTIYRIDTKNIESIPENGAAIIISNHVSFLDALFIFGLCPRPVKFVMYYKIFNIPILKYLFNSVGAIPIASKKENEEVFNNAFEKISEYLNNNEIVVIFPEGAITHDGNLQEFKPGILKILEKTSVNVYPTAISGLWGSMFSRKDKSIFRYFPKAFFNHTVKYFVGEPIESKNVTLALLEESVSKLRIEK